MSEPSTTTRSPESMLVALCDAVAEVINSATVTVDNPSGGNTPESPTSTEVSILLETGVNQANVTFKPLARLDALGESGYVEIVPIDDPEARQGMSALFIGDYDLDIVIYGRVGKGSDADTKCREFMSLRQRIRDLFKGVQVSVSGLKTTRAVMVEVNKDTGPAYAQSKLFEEGIFLSVMGLRFTIMV